MSRITMHFAVGLAGVTFASLCGCGGLDDRSAGHRLPLGYRLVQKEQFQALYRSDGRIDRLLQDRDGDGRADAMILYRASGSPERAELDTDGDGLVDRWELFRSDGSLEAVAVSRQRSGRPDQWDWATPDGRVLRRELDEDGDAEPDRAEEPR